MADSVKLVVSGKEYPEVGKNLLVKSSWYFSALFSGKYKDSGEDSYKFAGWSTKAFEVLLQYITTGGIDLKDKNLDVISNALEISDYLAMDGFRPQLARTLITSWPTMKSQCGLELAELLDVEEKIKDYSFVKALSVVENVPERKDLTEVLNYDFLTLVTGMELFWNFALEELEWKDVLWEKVIQRYREILHLALQLPPHAEKARSLARNLRLHLLNANCRSFVWDFVTSSWPTSKCLKNALDASLVEVRQELRKLVSHIRLTFATDCYKVNTIGVAEFNTNSWSWNLKECKGRFASSHCLMKRDYATFLGDRGLFIMRMRNRFPVLIENQDLGAIVTRFPEEVCNCVSGKRIFIFDQNPETTSKLYQFDLFSKEFSHCVDVPASRAKLRGHGDIVYIVGYCSFNETDLCVFEYKTKSQELRLVARSNSFGFCVDLVIVVKRKVLIFSTDAYTVVDTLQTENQTLEVLPYVGFVKDMWDFSFVDCAVVEEKIIFLLSVNYRNEHESDFDMMVARFTPANGEIMCIGIIPQVLENDHFSRNFEIFQPQMQIRRPKDKIQTVTSEILKRLATYA